MVFKLYLILMKSTLRDTLAAEDPFTFYFVFIFFRHDVEISGTVKSQPPKAPSVFYATSAEIPKTQQFGVSLSWYE